jgi:hypothetical protein
VRIGFRHRAVLGESSDAAGAIGLLAKGPGESGQDPLLGAKISVKRVGSRVILALIRVEPAPSGTSVTTSLPHTGGRRYLASTWNLGSADEANS